MRIVVCAAVLLIFADVEISAKWSTPEGFVAYRSALRSLERKDVNHNIPNLSKRHERQNTQAINLDQLATKTSKEKMNKIKRPRGILRSNGRSIINDIKSFHNLDFKPRPERFTHLRVKTGGEFVYETPYYDNDKDATHIAQEGYGPPQYENFQEGPDGIHIAQEGKGPAQYATHDDDDDDEKPNNDVQVEKIVVLELPSDKDFELLSKYNQQQKMKELKKRLEGYWKKEYQPDYPILDEIEHKMKKKAGQYGK